MTDLITSDALAQALGVTQDAVRQWVAKGWITPTKLAGRSFFTAGDLDAMKNRPRKKRKGKAMKYTWTVSTHEASRDFSNGKDAHRYYSDCKKAKRDPHMTRVDREGYREQWVDSQDEFFPA